MDINDLRTLATVLVSLSFASIVWWAYGPSRKAYFDQAAQLPFDDVAHAEIKLDASTGLKAQQGEQA